ANVEAVKMGGTVIADDVARYLARPDGPFDLVFVDPPYSLGFDEVCGVLAGVVGCLAEGATVVLHRRTGEDRPEVAGLEPVDARRYGGAQLWRYEKETA
ncbi:MAG: RsmD family RNA methyltransferase, partial [Acidimicrobiia bacterium]|nr:RsmD family RNA methyltransferase [Acidimicrobiia bacterium]